MSENAVVGDRIIKFLYDVEGEHIDYMSDVSYKVPG